MTPTPDPLRRAAANLSDRRTLMDDGFWVSQKEMRALDDALAQPAPALDAPNPQKCDCRGAGSLYRNEHAFGCHMFAALGDPA